MGAMDDRTIQHIEKKFGFSFTDEQKHRLQRVYENSLADMDSQEMFVVTGELVASIGRVAHNQGKHPAQIAKDVMESMIKGQSLIDAGMDEGFDDDILSDIDSRIPKKKRTTSVSDSDVAWDAERTVLTERQEREARSLLESIEFGEEDAN